MRTFQYGSDSGGVAKAQSAKDLFHGTDVVSTAAPPRTVEIARNQVHMFAKHHGSNREDELFPNTTFSVVNIAHM